MYDVAVVGGGIVGLSVAMAVGERRPGARVVVLEKEASWGSHQSGRNSGVIHSGVYYRPGSAKASLCVAGNRSMAEFCDRHGIAYEMCGKVIVATGADELPRLEALRRRGVDNGVAVRQLDAGALRELEPRVDGIAGLHVPSTGIVDFGQVCRAFAGVVAGQGGELRASTTVVAIEHRSSAAVVATDGGDIEARLVVNCAGLHSDRIARRSGVDPGAQIVPFRGEYYELVPERRHLVRNLVYPVPNPDFPFLGVHLTRGIDGGVHAGPNAVPALKREGYRWRDVSVRDTTELLRYAGFWRLARRHAREGAKEVVRSLSKRAFVRSLQRLVPDVRVEDLVPAPAGVRAQALSPRGELVDDFLIVRRGGAVHVCNAPSPAATSSIEIGRAVVDQLPELTDLHASRRS